MPPTLLVFISPNHPQSNGVVEVAHKDIRHNVMIYYSENHLNFDLKNAILEAVDIHNNKIHTVTKYKPIELIHNTNEEISKIVIENKKFTNLKENDNYNVLDIRSHILIKKNCIKSGKQLLTRKLNIRDNKILGTITNLSSFS